MLNHYCFDIQKSDFHCFVACLTSFLRENGFNITQDEIVDTCPDLFNKGKHHEGSFDSQYFQKLEPFFPIKVSPFTKDHLTWEFPKQSIFITVAWRNDINAKHAVRVLGQNGDNVRLHNPIADRATLENADDFFSWRPRNRFFVEFTG